MQRNPSITYFAKVDFRDDRRLFGITQDMRAYGMLLIGKTGTGKSNVLISQILDDIRKQKSCIIWDVHNDLSDAIFKYCPEHLKKNIVYLNVPNSQCNIQFNPLRKVSYEKRALIASSILETFEKMFASSWGSRLEFTLLHILLTLLDQPKADFSCILKIIRNEEYRKDCMKHIVSEEVRGFWQNDFKRLTPSDLLPIISKISLFLSYPSVKQLLVTNSQPISIRYIMDHSKQLIISAPKGILGSEVSSLLSGLILSSVIAASMSRVELPMEQRKPCTLYLDEGQNYLTKSAVSLFSESRKFGINVVLTLHYVQELAEEIRYAIFANISTLLIFRVSAFDAPFLLREVYMDYQPEITATELTNLGNYKIWLKMMIHGRPSKPFTATTVPFQELL
ncbi:MAG: type IV secretion system DNA-binding domain-containing protein [Bacteroidetes bacterium]|nr:type IV secretion system DNA-binding domain-containing protein [Bacteroidota bacterium]